MQVTITFTEKAKQRIETYEIKDIVLSDIEGISYEYEFDTDDNNPSRISFTLSNGSLVIHYFDDIKTMEIE